MTVERIALESLTLRRLACQQLRDAVQDFNQSATTLASIDRLREAVLAIADMLDFRVEPSVEGDAMLADVVQLRDVMNADVVQLRGPHSVKV